MKMVVLKETLKFALSKEVDWQTKPVLKVDPTGRWRLSDSFFLHLFGDLAGRNIESSPNPFIRKEKSFSNYAGYPSCWYLYKLAFIFFSEK